MGFICLAKREEEIVFPSDGAFKVQEYSKTYVMNGEPAAARPASSLDQANSSQPLGIPMSYQRSERTSLNPPPVRSSTQTLVRPSFNTSGSQKATWKKSIVVVDVVPSGSITNKFQVHLTLTEETATVDEVQRMLEQQMGFEVILLDAKHLPVISGESTKGKLQPTKAGSLTFLVFMS